MTVQWQMTYISGTGSYVTAWEIDNPVNDISLVKTSNMRKVDLIDGDITRITPSVKYNYSEVQFQFNFVDEDNVLIKDNGTTSKSIDYIFTNNYKTKITDHEGYEWVGYFMETSQLYKLGQYVASDGTFKTFYDIDVKFDVVSRTAGT
jgi:hypothetical protein